MRQFSGFLHFLRNQFSIFPWLSPDREKNFHDLPLDLTFYVKFSLITAKSKVIWGEENKKYRYWQQEYNLILWVRKELHHFAKISMTFPGLNTISLNFKIIPSLAMLLQIFKTFPCFFVTAGTLTYSGRTEEILHLNASNSIQKKTF